MAGGLVRACVCLWILTTADCRTPDIQVTCTFAQDCLLPCIFEPASSVNVSWQQQEDLFLTFRLGAGPEELLLPSYADRASLFEEQVSHGNASLQIKQTSTQDRGRYRCTVSTDRAVEDTIVIVRVEAPLRSLTLEITGDCRAVKCSSQDVYPAPHLSWSTEPSLQPELLRPSTHMAANKLGLYSVESRLNRPKTGSGYTYTCTIKTSYGSQTWMASLRDTEMRPTEGTQVTIPCTAPRNLQNFTLTWSFTRQRQLSIILTYDSLTRHVTNHWGKRAHLDHNWASSGDGSLHLQDLGSSAQTGMYICMISTPRTKYLTYTSVNVSAISGMDMSAKGMGSSATPPKEISATIITGIRSSYCQQKRAVGAELQSPFYGLMCDLSTVNMNVPAVHSRQAAVWMSPVRDGGLTAPAATLYSVCHRCE